MPLLGKAAMLLSFDIAEAAIPEHDEWHTQEHLPERLGDWLEHELLAKLPKRAGLGSAHLLKGALAPKMTNEQRIRGLDQGIDWALLTTGYGEDALAAVAENELGNGKFDEHGAAGTLTALYRTDFTLAAGEIDA